METNPVHIHPFVSFKGLWLIGGSEYVELVGYKVINHEKSTYYHQYPIQSPCLLVKPYKTTILDGITMANSIVFLVPSCSHCGPCRALMLVLNVTTSGETWRWSQPVITYWVLVLYYCHAICNSCCCHAICNLCIFLYSAY